MAHLSRERTLWRLMVLVPVLGVGVAILCHASTHWGTGEVLTIAPTFLLATNVLAWFLRARWRAFWVGFGLSGWTYLAISLGSPAGKFLPTTWMLDGLHGQLYPSPPDTPYAYEDYDVRVFATDHGARFRRAGQSAISLLIALLGGAGARILFSKRCEDRGVCLPPDGSLLKPRWRDRDHQS